MTICLKGSQSGGLFSYAENIAPPVSVAFFLFAHNICRAEGATATIFRDGHQGKLLQSAVVGRQTFQNEFPGSACQTEAFAI